MKMATPVMDVKPPKEDYDLLSIHLMKGQEEAPKRRYKE